MSHVPRRSRAHAGAPGEVVTNWKLLAIIGALAVAIAWVIASSLWPRSRVQQSPSRPERQAAAPLRGARELGREPLVFRIDRRQLQIELEFPPRHTPGIDRSFVALEAPPVKEPGLDYRSLFADNMLAKTEGGNGGIVSAALSVKLINFATLDEQELRERLGGTITSKEHPHASTYGPIANAFRAGLAS